MWARMWRLSGGRTASTDSGQLGQAQPRQHGQAPLHQQCQVPPPQQQQDHGHHRQTHHQQRHQATQGRKAKKKSPSRQSQPG